MSNENRSNNKAVVFGIGVAGFAAGALVTLLAIRGGALGEGYDSASFAGTMVVRDGQVVAQDIAEIALSDAAITGTVDIERRGNMVQAIFAINSPEAVEVRLDLPEAGMAFGGIAETGRPLPPAIIQEGSISMMSRGEREFAVFLNQNATDAKSVKVSFISGGKVVREEVVELPKRN